MSKEYQVYRLFCQGTDKDGKANNNIEALNTLLKDGWVPVRESPAHPVGGWSIMGWLVVLEREKPNKPVEEKAKRPELAALLQGVINRAKDEKMSEDDFLAELSKI